MNLPDEFSAFCTVTVNPKTITKVKVPAGTKLSLTTGAAVPPKGVESGRVVLYARVNDGPEVAIFPFTIGKFESATTDLFFTEGDAIEFMTKGAEAIVQISGYVSDGFSLFVEEIAKK
ncbi:hypothetical protein TRFO_13562 [Tritrichomonas foetus]|uniref:Nucleoplasmin-like domain-containing protein n=1 Tax=Tritrichomonas foetus TaxID=1144522 RepID=A0A1J4L2D3_9EUKA|nr:hypothetical protein TRFO_13562 [Tritrichomonas foetus]|eukprot:OHT16053.1 hypothetical protein TRFO_13562 [Tritrichomonas foetus]